MNDGAGPLRGGGAVWSRLEEQAEERRKQPLDYGSATTARVLAAVIAMVSDRFLLEVRTTLRFEGVYVQGMCENGRLLLEVPSNQCLQPPLTQEQVRLLLDLGWHVPEHDSPNYWKLLQPEDQVPGTLARWLMQALVDVYGVTSDDELTLSPAALASEIFSSDGEVVMLTRMEEQVRGAGIVEPRSLHGAPVWWPPHFDWVLLAGDALLLGSELGFVRVLPDGYPGATPEEVQFQHDDWDYPFFGYAECGEEDRGGCQAVAIDSANQRTGDELQLPPGLVPLEAAAALHPGTHTWSVYRFPEGDSWQVRTPSNAPGRNVVALLKENDSASLWRHLLPQADAQGIFGLLPPDLDHHLWELAIPYLDARDLEAALPPDPDHPLWIRALPYVGAGAIEAVLPDDPNHPLWESAVKYLPLLKLQEPERLTRAARCEAALGDLAALAHDSAASVRLAVARNASTREPVLKRLAGDSDVEVAVEALIRLNWTSASLLAPTLSSVSLAAYVSHLQRESTDPSYLLPELNSDQAVHLVEALEASSEFRVQLGLLHRASRRLLASRHDTALTVLLALVHDADNEIRMAALGNAALPGWVALQSVADRPSLADLRIIVARRDIADRDLAPLITIHYRLEENPFERQSLLRLRGVEESLLRQIVSCEADSGVVAEALRSTACPEVLIRQHVTDPDVFIRYGALEAAYRRSLTIDAQTARQALEAPFQNRPSPGVSVLEVPTRMVRELAADLLREATKPDTTALALSVARCREVPIARTDKQHPCHKVVCLQSARPSEWQVPEPWAGNIETAKVVFVSSNPSISEAGDSTSGDVVENYPREDWSDEDIADFVRHRFDPAGQWATADGRFRRQDGTLSGVVTFWAGVRKRASEVLDRPADPDQDYAMTEVVHCKSKGQKGVRQAAAHCSARHLERILAASTARLVVILGREARDLLVPQWKLPPTFGTSTTVGIDEKINLAVRELGGQQRVVAFLWHPSGMTAPKKFSGAYGTALPRLQALLSGHLEPDDFL